MFYGFIGRLVQTYNFHLISFVLLFQITDTYIYIHLVKNKNQNQNWSKVGGKSVVLLQSVTKNMGKTTIWAI